MLPIAAILGSGLAMAEDAWIQGSWVNLRSAAGPTASVKGQLTTNMQVQVTAREGEWCAVRTASPVSEGYVHCSLIGPSALTLTKVADQPGRAFWIAPSAGRLMAYGALLRTSNAYKRMFEKLQDGEVARIQPLPEFDAAKRLMALGVVPKLEAEVNRGSEVAPEAMEFFELLKPTPIKSSFFKTQGDIVMRSEGSGDALAAVTRSKVSVKVVAPPAGYVSRHEGPEISGISGFGDMGDIELHFAPAILVYSLLPNGLLGGSNLSKQTISGVPEYGASCGITYMGSGIGAPTSDGSMSLELKPAPGFPRVPESMLLMASFVTAKPLSTRKLVIRSRAARITDLQMLKGSDSRQDSSLPKAIPKVVLHEVDFNGDGVADMLIWDAPSIGSMSGGYNLRRAWYLNIDGRWYAAGGMDDQECT